MEKGTVIVPADDYKELVILANGKKVDMEKMETLQKKADLLDRIADAFYKNVVGFYDRNVLSSVFYDNFEEDFEKVYEGISDRMVEKACVEERTRKEKKDED